ACHGTRGVDHSRRRVRSREARELGGAHPGDRPDLRANGERMRARSEPSERRVLQEPEGAYAPVPGQRTWSASGFVDAIAAGVALPAVLVADDPLRRRVSTEQAKHLVTHDPEAVGYSGRDRHCVAPAERHLAILLAVDPRLGHAVEDVQHFHVGMGVDGSRVAGLRGLDAGADRRGSLVVAEDQLIDRVGSELDHFRLVEAHDLQLVHGSPSRPKSLAGEETNARYAIMWLGP